MHKFDDIRWKWLEERGIQIYGDLEQVEYMKKLWEPVKKNQAVFCEGKAGTGKTTLAVLAGAYEVMQGTYDRIIYIRNAVSVRDQGFLPGTEKEKNAPYMAPIADALQLIEPYAFEEWITEENENGEPKLVPITTSYVRGITWDNAYVIVDEAQNFDREELQAVYTRCSKSSKVVSVGSTRQCDNKRIKRVRGLLPFEVFAIHFEGYPTISNHTLTTCHRGWFAGHADEIQETIDRLELTTIE